MCRNFVVLCIFVLGAFATTPISAGWTNAGQVGGVQVYRDSTTNLEWTVSLSRVGSAGAAQQKVANLGFRLPSHSEFRSLERSGGIRQLGIDTAWGSGFYWEGSGRIVNGHGGNFKSLLPVSHPHIGNPYAIGVRSGGTSSPPPNNNQGVSQGSSQNNQGPKIHMLFVWGTKAKDTEWSTLISKKKIEDAFNGPIGLSKTSPYVGTYQTLEGNNATAQNIILACQQLARNAKPNDAVFVYILCHGASVVEDGDSTGTRVHALSPVCDDATNINLRTIGIRRSRILQEMKSTQHRLNMLITDSCTTVRSEPPNSPTEPPRGPSALTTILRTAQGTININSSHPNKGSMNQGERAMSYVPFIKDAGNNYLEYACQDEFSGTVFTNAFIKIAGPRPDVSGNSYSKEQFLADLGAKLSEQYRATKNWMQDNNGDGLESFMQQQTQTLTQFDDRGVALP